MDAANHGIFFHSRELTITINGDQLTAEYKVSAFANSQVASTAESDTGTEAGDDLVNNILGQVLVGESRYGVTGHQFQSSTLTFNPPQIQLEKDNKNQLIITLDIHSASFRLYERRQQITILPPVMGVAGRSAATLIQINAPSVQITSPVDANVIGITNGTANLQVNPAKLPQTGNASFAVSEGETSSGWFDGLRAVGRITFPIVDASLNRVSAIFDFGIFLWALYRTRRKFPDNRLVNVSLRTAETVVVALAAVAALGFAYDLSTKLWGPNNRSYLAAGPLGLLIGGATAFWPVVCWRAGAIHSGDLRRTPGPARRSRRFLLLSGVLLRMAAYLTIATLYLVRLQRLGVDPGITVIAGTVAIMLSVQLLARVLLGCGLLSGIASVGLLGTAFLAACSWPLLYASTWWFSTRVQSAHINLWGKWIYVTVAVAVTAGLCVMWGRVTWTVLRSGPQRSRIVQWVAVMVVAAVILAAIVPDVISESNVASPRAVGLTALDLFGLLDATPQLLAWLLLVLAIAVTMRLPSEPDPRGVARDLALPIAVNLLYWTDTWLYIPVSMIAGIFLIRRLMMPSKLAHEAPPADGPETWVKVAAERWRHADFVAGQQQALATSSTEALRESVLGTENSEFQRRLTRLTKAQDDLAARRDALQRAAMLAKIGAFSHRGAMPDLGSAAVGTLTGAVLGIIPATVTLLTTNPPSAGGTYPVLSFFGSTAWNLFTYAGLGWFVGYFLPLIRGDSGAGKAFWIFIAGAAGSVPNGLIWNDAQDWTVTMIYDLNMLVFLMVLTVIVCDLRTLQRAGLRPTDWVRVHNWRFVASWSAALVAAIGTIVITFATTTVTDLSQQLTRQAPVTSSSAGSSPGGSGSGAG